MKQTVCITLLFSMFLCLFSGCAASGTGATTPQQTTQPPAATTAPTEAPTAAPTTLPDVIDTAYNYPLRRSMAKWEQLSAKEQIAATEIPDDILPRMTTPALLETLYAYPRWTERRKGAYGRDVYYAYTKWTTDFNLTQELQSRDDLKKWIKELDCSHFSVRDIMTADEIKDADYAYRLICIWLPYTDGTPYAYPITPTSAEWATMTEAEKIAACQIPEEVLSRLSPDALEITMLNYPLLADVATATDPKAAMLETMKTCDAVKELSNRSFLTVMFASSDWTGVADYTKDYLPHALDAYNDIANTTADRSEMLE